MEASGKKTTVVKFVARGKDSSTLRWLRQFPGRKPDWGECHFSFDRGLRQYDWLVVYDDLPSETGSLFSGSSERLACPRSNTLLITTEPSSVKIYGTSFLKQFGNILTSQENDLIKLPSAIHSQPGLRWYYGMGRATAVDYDTMKSTSHPPKTAAISTVCSSKQQTHTLHKKRYDFIQWLAERMPDLQVFGHGVRDIEDKAEAIDSFRYHIAIENHVCEHHWTEKLSDCFLGWSLPIYHGCPNATDYFPEDSFIRIDIDHPEEAERIIRGAIEDGEYERRLPAISEARRLVLDEYNLFAVIERIIRERDAGTSESDMRPLTIHSRHAIRRKRLMLPLLELAIEKRRFLRKTKKK